MAQDTPPRPDPRPRTDPAQARRRLRRISGFRLGRGHFAAAVIAALLGLAFVTQARVVDEAGLSDLRQADLVALLDDATERVDRLEAEVRRLEADRTRLLGEDGEAAAAQAARQRLESYEILAGMVGVQGPGISVWVRDPEATLTQTMLLDGIQELRDAGAEAIQIHTVRVVASSHVGTAEDGSLTVDGVALPREAFQIVAVGEARTLAGGLAIPGGFSDSLRGAGATVTVNEADDLRIDALHRPEEARYARPVSEDPGT